MRKLSLSKEVLSELTTQEMRVVVAGATGALCIEVITERCITTPYSGLDCLSDRYCN
jgi:hypothetical protein